MDCRQGRQNITEILGIVMDKKLQGDYRGTSIAHEPGGSHPTGFDEAGAVFTVYFLGLGFEEGADLEAV